MLKVKRYSTEVAVILEERIVSDRHTKKPRVIYVPAESICAEKHCVDAWVKKKETKLQRK